ncbi:MAG TPA: hypothetical protein DCZ91_05145 [Lachnospiraceae bacterium]|nr:hypothetical protein [Lachnospiraceae bacterium]
MKIGKIRFVNEILTEQMNHWMLFPLALIVGGASRYLTGEGNPMLLAWALCSLFPFFFFLIRCAAGHLLPFVLLHLAVAALSLLVPVSFPAGKAVCILCAAGYLLYSHILRLKHDELFSNGMHLPAGVGIAAFSAFFVHYLEVRGWDNYHVIALIAAISLYFIVYYIEHYLNFLSVNESSAGFLPAAEMFHSGMGLVLAYTLLGAGILVLSSQFAWLAGILQPLKALLLRFLRFLFSGKAEEPTEKIEIPIIEELQQDNMEEMTLPEAAEPFWLWKVLEVIAIAVLIIVICGIVVLSLVKLFLLIRQYLNLHLHRERGLETGDTCDFREKCELERNPDRKRQSLLNALSPHERIRKLYKKKLLSSSPRLSEEDRNRMDIYTAKEWEQKLETRGMSDIYEQARYSNRAVTGADVKRMKEACR